MSLKNEIFLTAIGWSAFTFSLIYRVPQIYKIYKTKSVEDISVWFIHIQNFSYICYVLYGIGRLDTIYIVSSAVSFLQNIFISFLRYYYHKKPQTVQQFPINDLKTIQIIYEKVNSESNI